MKSTVLDADFEEGKLYIDLYTANNTDDILNKNLMCIPNVLIDTGAGLSLFSSGDLSSVEVKHTGRYHVCQGINGIKFKAEIVHIPILLIGQLRLFNQIVGMYDIGEDGTNRGILGYDILNCFDIEIENSTKPRTMKLTKCERQRVYNLNGFEDFQPVICSIDSKETDMQEDNSPITVSKKTVSRLLSQVLPSNLIKDLTIDEQIKEAEKILE